MVQILPPAETSSSLFAKQILNGIQRGTDLGMQLSGKSQKRKENDLSKLSTTSQKYLKNFAPAFLKNPDRYEEVLGKAKEYVNQGYGPDDAISLAVKDKSPSIKSSPQESRSLSSHPYGLVGELLEPALKGIKRKPSLLATEAPGAAAGALETFQQLLHDPIGGNLNSLLGGDKNKLSSVLKSQLRNEETPEHTQQAERIGDIEQFIAEMLVPIPGAKGAKGLSKVAQTLESRAPRAISSLEKETSSIASGRFVEPLTQRASEAAPEGATQLRMQRLAPESKMFKTGEQKKILEQQLKMHPQYAAEIAADAEKRSARLNRVLGPKALATKESRMALAEAELPQAKKSYERAISRVRALEDQLSSKGTALTQRESALFESAKKELEESEFFLRQILSNAKHGEARVGLEQMRNAAREKMLRIQDLASEGKPIELAKMDHSPDLIKRAKEISNKKAIPSTKTDDFYTQIHDEYANAYRGRLKELEESLQSPVRSLAQAEGKRNASREAESLRKMIQSAEAENTIHRHNLGLREMQQRKVARDRLSKAVPEKGSAKVQEVFKNKVQEASKTPEGMNRVVDDIAREASRVAPKLGEQVEKNRSSLIDAINQVKSSAAKAPEALGAKTEKEAINTVDKAFKDLKNSIDKLLEKIPGVGTSAYMKNIAMGVITGVADEFLDQIDAPFTSLDALTIFTGRTMRGAALRYLVKRAVKGVGRQWRVQQVRDAYEKGDNQKILELREKYSPSIMKEGASL